MYKPRKPYFDRFTCVYCKNKATHYVCASNHKRHYMICDNKKCERKTLFKLHYYTLGIKGIEKYAQSRKDNAPI